MPTSWYQAIPAILTQVKKLEPATILDIGVGFGKYGLLFRDVLEIPWERYHKQEELVTCYQSADIHVFPSRYEGFGMPPLEQGFNDFCIIHNNIG